MRQKNRVAAQVSMTGKFAEMRRLHAARRDGRRLGNCYLRFQRGWQGEDSDAMRVLGILRSKIVPLEFEISNLNDRRVVGTRRREEKEFEI